MMLLLFALFAGAMTLVYLVAYEALAERNELGIFGIVFLLLSWFINITTIGLMWRGAGL